MDKKKVLDLVVKGLKTRIQQITRDISELESLKQSSTIDSQMRRTVANAIKQMHAFRTELLGDLAEANGLLNRFEITSKEPKILDCLN